MEPEDIAKVCHDAIRSFCMTHGDTSHKSWEEAPFAIKQSAIAGVVWLIQNPNAKLNALHENWRKYKQIEGWIYGPEKDFDAKTHPCMVPYEELAPEQQVKDKLFRAIVASLTSGDNHA